MPCCYKREKGKNFLTSATGVPDWCLATGFHEIGKKFVWSYHGSGALISAQRADAESDLIETNISYTFTFSARGQFNNACAFQFSMLSGLATFDRTGKITHPDTTTEPLEEIHYTETSPTIDSSLYGLIAATPPYVMASLCDYFGSGGGSGLGSIFQLGEMDGLVWTTDPGTRCSGEDYYTRDDGPEDYDYIGDRELVWGATQSALSSSATIAATWDYHRRDGLGWAAGTNARAGFSLIQIETAC